MKKHEITQLIIIFISWILSGVLSYIFNTWWFLVPISVFTSVYFLLKIMESVYNINRSVDELDKVVNGSKSGGGYDFCKLRKGEIYFYEELEEMQQHGWRICSDIRTIPNSGTGDTYEVWLKRQKII